MNEKNDPLLNSAPAACPRRATSKRHSTRLGLLRFLLPGMALLMALAPLALGQDPLAPLPPDPLAPLAPDPLAPLPEPSLDSIMDKAGRREKLTPADRAVLKKEIDRLWKESMESFQPKKPVNRRAPIEVAPMPPIDNTTFEPYPLLMVFFHVRVNASSKWEFSGGGVKSAREDAFTYTFDVLHTFRLRQSEYVDEPAYEYSSDLNNEHVKYRDNIMGGGHKTQDSEGVTYKESWKYMPRSAPFYDSGSAAVVGVEPIMGTCLLVLREPSFNAEISGEWEVSSNGGTRKGKLDHADAKALWVASLLLRDATNDEKYKNLMTTSISPAERKSTFTRSKHEQWTFAYNNEHEVQTGTLDVDMKLIYDAHPTMKPPIEDLPGGDDGW